MPKLFRFRSGMNFGWAFEQNENTLVEVSIGPFYKCCACKCNVLSWEFPPTSLGLEVPINGGGKDIVLVGSVCPPCAEKKRAARRDAKRMEIKAKLTKAALVPAVKHQRMVWSKTD